MPTRAAIAMKMASRAYSTETAPRSARRLAITSFRRHEYAERPTCPPVINDRRARNQEMGLGRGRMR